jgi:hypothetical protein
MPYASALMPMVAPVTPGIMLTPTSSNPSLYSANPPASDDVIHFAPSQFANEDVIPTDPKPTKQSMFSETRPRLRARFYFTWPFFFIQFPTLVVGLVGIGYSNPALNVFSSEALPLLQCHFIVHLGQAIYAALYILVYGACLHNPYSTKRSISEKRQNWKLKARKLLILPLELAFLLTWTALSLITRFANGASSMYQSTCPQDPQGSACSRANALFILSVISCLISVLATGFIIIAIWKNSKKLKRLRLSRPELES